jgi:DNA-binding transcriptional ArsR family regulator
MSDSGDGDYSAIFTALKHPVRRKILRMLSEKSRSFSEMLEAFKIESSHLTYHLDALGVLVSKTPDGKYRLSLIGEAATSMMYQVEEIPKTPLHVPLLHTKSKVLFALLMVGLVLSAGVIGYALSYAIYAPRILDLQEEISTLRTDYDDLNTTYNLLKKILSTHSDVTYEQLKLTVDLEKVVFAVGERINVTLRLTNIGSENVSFWASPFFFNFDVLDTTNRTVYRWSNGRIFPFLCVILPEPLRPWEYVEQTLSWEQTSPDYAGEQVSAGIYYIVGMCSPVLTAPPIGILIWT